MPRGRKPGQVIKRKESQKGYIIINNKLRIRVEPDCLTVEELISTNNETGEATYGNFKYFSSWYSVLDYLVKLFTAKKISDKGTINFAEAKQEILNCIKELKQILLGEIEQQMKTADEEIKKAIQKFI